MINIFLSVHYQEYIIIGFMVIHHHLQLNTNLIIRFELCQRIIFKIPCKITVVVINCYKVTQTRELISSLDLQWGLLSGFQLYVLSLCWYTYTNFTKYALLYWFYFFCFGENQLKFHYTYIINIRDTHGCIFC